MRPTVSATFFLAVLGVALGGMWLLADTRWAPPTKVALDASLLDPPSILPQRDQAGKLTEQVERPLVSVNRRPSPPEQATVAPPAVADPLKGVTVLGLFSNDQGVAGVIFRLENGKVVRLQLGEQVEGWGLVRVEGNTAELADRAGKHTRLEIRHLPQRAEGGGRMRMAEPSGQPPSERVEAALEDGEAINAGVRILNERNEFKGGG